MLGPKDFIKILTDKNYFYKLHHHEPLFTVTDSQSLRGKIDGAHSKNLFLKNKKNKFFLISSDENSLINLKQISKSLKLGNVSFAKEEFLKNLLGISPGSVSPFALLNNRKNDIDFYLEDRLYNSSFINFHPLTNTATITMETKDFIKLMIANNKKINIFSSAEGVVIKTYGNN